MDDQRTSKRLSHETPLVIENCDSGTYSYGRMYNYSKGGFYFESDTPYQTGTRIRIDIEKSKIGLDAGQYFAEVKWCAEISAAVVLYDYGIGAEFDPKINAGKGNGKLKVIKGGEQRNKPPL
ncbi:MAG: PilZ domain-containing protein [Deltaproteobacteria bacterium]